MESITSQADAERIMGHNYLGPKQANILLNKMGIESIIETEVPDVNFTEEVLINSSKDYILVYGVDAINILDFRKCFGVNPDKSEPCLYNQDWYLSESFIQRRMDNKWFLLKKNVFENTRGVMPIDIIKQNIKFPTAIQCVYTFFAYFFVYGEMLWYHDFLWCEDVDHNGDRIYVGKYHDIDGINKNGFSIHRHLSLRPCYASINLI